MKRSIIALALLACSAALAQGTEQTPAQRDIMVIAHLLPGLWDNGEQVEFAPRVKNGATYPHAQTRIERIAAPAFGEFAFRERTSAPDASVTLLKLDPASARNIRMSFYAPAPGNADGTKLGAGDWVAKGCPIVFTREAGQFSAEAAKDCTTAPAVAAAMLTPTKLWIEQRLADKPAQPFTRYSRAREFECYVDMPGASGNRAVLFRRTSGLMIHDQAGVAWFDSPETPSRRLGVKLRAVDWPVNTAPGIFTRDSLTLYVEEMAKDGTTKTLFYGWTEPTASRIGLNNTAMLVNCSSEPMALAKPEF